MPSPCPTQGGGSGYSSVTRARPRSAEPELARACFARRGSGLLSAPHMRGTAAGRGVFSSRSCMQCNVRRSAAHLVGAWLYVHHASHRVMARVPPTCILSCARKACTMPSCVSVSTSGVSPAHFVCPGGVLGLASSALVCWFVHSVRAECPFRSCVINVRVPRGRPECILGVYVPNVCPYVSWACLVPNVRVWVSSARSS